MSMIFARRIPSGLGYIPGRGLRARTVRGGMGAADYGPAYTPRAGEACADGYAKNTYGYCVKSGTAPKTGTGTGWASIATSLFAPKPEAPTGSMPGYMQADSGMSTNTMIAIGLGAAGLLAIVMLTRK